MSVMTFSSVRLLANVDLIISINILGMERYNSL